MIRTLIAVLILSGLSSCFRSPCDTVGFESTPDNATEQMFNSTEGRFRIGLPPPANPNVTDFKWMVLNRGQFQVIYSDYQYDVENNIQQAFDNIKNLLLSKRPGKIEAERDLMLSGHPGREIRIKDESGVDIQRLYIVGQRLYIVRAFVPRKLEGCALEDVLKTLDSFELTGQNSSA